MASNLLKKKTLEELHPPLSQIPMEEEDWAEFIHGITLFNEGKFWHAHEAWEEVWRRHPEPERLFFQGLIQSAAAYHHVGLKKSYKGIVNNFNKSHRILSAFAPRYLGVETSLIIDAIRVAKRELEQHGSKSLTEFALSYTPKIQFQKPPDPDLQVGICDVLRSPEFAEGAARFNEHLFWDAHEVWEEIRKKEEGGTKKFVEAFTQMSLAFNFLAHRKQSSAAYLLEKAIDNLREFEQQACEYPLEELLGHLNKVRAKVAAGTTIPELGCETPKVPLLK